MMANPHDRGAVLDIIERQAERSNIPREDFLRFAYIETGGKFNANAYNEDSHAKGLFQFVPGTAKAYGLTGREFDPAANTEAAATLYGRNRTDIMSRHEHSGRPYLSGAESPNGLDMYLAHQQGAAGYASIQSAIATGNFSLDSTRRNILGNISSRDFEQVTGQPYNTVRGMDDRELWRRRSPSTGTASTPPSRSRTVASPQVRRCRGSVTRWPMAYCSAVSAAMRCAPCRSP